MVKLSDFFIKANAVSNISDEEYQKIDVLIDTFDAVSRIAYQSLYIIDYYKQNFLYVSNNPLFLCGHTAQEVHEMGYSYYTNFVPEEEQIMLIEINKAGFDFFEKTPF